MLVYGGSDVVVRVLDSEQRRTCMYGFRNRLLSEPFYTRCMPSRSTALGSNSHERVSHPNG